MYCLMLFYSWRVCVTKNVRQGFDVKDKNTHILFETLIARIRAEVQKTRTQFHKFVLKTINLEVITTFFE